MCLCVSGRSCPALLPEHLSLILILVQPPKWRVSLQQGVLLFSGTKIRCSAFTQLSLPVINAKVWVLFFFLYLFLLLGENFIPYFSVSQCGGRRWGCTSALSQDCRQQVIISIFFNLFFCLALIKCSPTHIFSLDHLSHSWGRVRLGHGTSGFFWGEGICFVCNKYCRTKFRCV